MSCFAATPGRDCSSHAEHGCLLKSKGGLQVGKLAFAHVMELPGVFMSLICLCGGFLLVGLSGCRRESRRDFRGRVKTTDLGYFSSSAGSFGQQF